MRGWQFLTIALMLPLFGWLEAQPSTAPFISAPSSAESGPIINSDTRHHKKTCWFEESFFEGFKRRAGIPIVPVAPPGVKLETITFVTSDSVTLRGYRLRGSVNPKGYILFAQGDAMLADYLAGWLAPLVSTGFDVYVYDFRGYGRSEGKSLFSDITLDYDEIIKTLNSTIPGRHMLYGISFGGIVLLRSMADGAAYDAAVIDSVPSKLPVALNCDSSANPVNNLPTNSSHILLISGGKDKQVPPNDMEKLIGRGRQYGAQIILDGGLQHPALDPTEDHHVRFPAIEAFWRKFL